MIQRWWAGWSQFWFDPIDLYNVSLYRTILGLVMLVFYGIRYTQFDYYFSAQGVLPVEWVQDIIPDGYRSFIPFYVASDSWVNFQGILHLALIVLFASGFMGRAWTWLLFVVNLGLMQRNLSVIYGADLFTNFWLFYLSFIRHNQYFSVLNILRPGRAKIMDRLSDPMSTMGVRFLQVQLCLSYAYTGIEKFKGISWWEGSAIWYVIGMEEFIPHDFAFLKNFPLVVVLLSMSTLIFEVYFIFAVWIKSLRPYWLFTGFLFHLSTAIFMNLWFFFLTMTSTYIVFFEERVTLKGARSYLQTRRSMVVAKKEVVGP